MTLDGNPETWTAVERYIYVPPSALPGSSAGPLSTPPQGWSEGGHEGANSVLVRERPLPSGRPDRPFGQSSVVAFQPSELVVDGPGRSDSFIPEDGSVVVIHAPAGAVIETYPASSADPEIFGTTPERRIKLAVTRFASSASSIAVRTAPAWGRDPIWAGVWTASLSSVVSGLIGLIWAVVLLLFSDQIKAALLWIWRKVRPPKAASVSP